MIPWLYLLVCAVQQDGSAAPRVRCEPPLALSSAPGERSAWIEDALATAHGRVHVLLRELHDGTWRLQHRALRGPPWEAGPPSALSADRSVLAARLALDGENGVFALWCESDGAGARILVQASEDGGGSWRVAPVLLDEAPFVVPELALAATAGGVLLAAWTVTSGAGSEVRVQRSPDGGRTWLAAPFVLLAAPGVWCSPPALAIDGEARAVVAAAVERAGRRELVLRHSEDGGARWRASQTPALDGAVTAVYLERLAPAELLVLCTLASGPVRCARSTDGGATFSTPVTLATASELDVERFVDLDHDEHGLHVLTVSGGPDGASGATAYRTWLATSADRGRTWLPAHASPPHAEPLEPPCAAVACSGADLWIARVAGTPDFPELRVARSDRTGSPPGDSMPVSAPGIRARMSSPRLLAVPGGVALLWIDRGTGTGAATACFTALHADARTVASAPPRPPLVARAPPADLPALAPAQPSAETLPPPPPGLAPVAAGSFALAGGGLRARFDVAPGGIQLTAMDVAGGTHLTFGRGSGSWTLHLRARADPAAEVRVTAEDDGVRFLGAEASESELSCRWSGRVALAGEPVTFAVSCSWRMESDEPALLTRVEVTLDAAPGLYLSEVLYPRVFVAAIDGDDRLVLPAHGGLLLVDPIRNRPDLARFNGRGPWLNLPLLAYYGNRSRTCFAYGEENPRHHLLVHNVGLRPGHEELEFLTRHIPPDVYAARSFRAPYWIRLELGEGDWIEVAERERRRAAARDPFYRGPVGAPSNSMPASMKELLYTWSYAGDGPDALDGLARELAVLGSLWDRKAYVRLYGAHWPDRMGALYQHDYLPGVPSFRAAVREGQALGALVAPLVPSSTAFDPRGHAPADPERAERNRDILGAAVRREDGSFLDPISTNLVMCNGAPWWKENFVRTATEVLAFTGAGGLYLDFFVAPACYAEDHAHAPGGGTHPWQGRIEDLQRIRAAARALGREVALSLEAPQGRVAGLIDVVHVFPRARVFGLTSCVSIPFFRWVRDDTRISRHPSLRFGEVDPRAAGWALATEVFPYGQLPVRPATREPRCADLLAADARATSFYFARILDFLGTEGFLRWHNGSLVRPPELTVESARALPAGERTIPGYFDAPLVAALFRAWDGSFAYVITNPWLDDAEPIEFRATLDPARSERFPASFSFGQLGSSDRALHRGPLELAGALGPGEIRCWMFEPALEGDGAPTADEPR